MSNSNSSGNAAQNAAAAPEAARDPRRFCPITGLNLRSAPDLRSDILRVLQVTETVTELPDAETADGGLHVVTADGREGFCVSDYLLEVS